MASDEVRYEKAQSRSVNRIQYKPGIKTLTVYFNESIFLNKGDEIKISLPNELRQFNGTYLIRDLVDGKSLTIQTNINLSYDIDEDVSGSFTTNYTYMTYEEAWAENGYLDPMPFNVSPSSGSWKGSMAGMSGRVSAEPELESIGQDGTDEPYVIVSMKFPEPYKNKYPDRTYEMPLEVYIDWSNNPSGSFYNSNIRGKYTPKS